MGKQENPLLEYYSQNKRFAELLNGWLFEGAPHWKADDVSDADRRQGGKSRKGKEYRHRYRDLYKKLDDTLVHLFIGTELQEYVDYAMPLRVMDSDVLSYLHQKKTVSGNMGKETEGAGKKSLTGDEYLSRFAKADRLRPVITLVLYCGEEPWNGARCLHEMLDFKNISDKVKKYVADYPVHILDVCHTADERLRQFPSDICFLLMSMKYAKDKEAFSRLKELTGTAVISEDTYETIAEYLGEPELLKKEAEEGGRDMCEAIRALVEDGRNEGLEQGLKQGLEQGIELTKQVFRLAGEQIAVENIAKALSISKEEVEKILE